MILGLDDDVDNKAVEDVIYKEVGPFEEFKQMKAMKLLYT